jgi:hypothetical protein
VGAGIGLTPCASVLRALTKYKWRKNFNPERVYFYWVRRKARERGLFPRISTALYLSTNRLYL